MNHYHDRRDAGLVLAQTLMDFAKKPQTIVLALPRGGVPVGYEIAKALDLPLDILLVRKLGVPQHRELAMGAIASNGICLLNQRIIDDFALSQSMIEKVIEQESKELTRREVTYRGHKPYPILKDKTIILVDDGMATGATMLAAISALHQQAVTRIVVAVPVGAPEICHSVANQVNQFICPLQPAHFSAVGQWYQEFEQTTDDEVIKILNQYDN